MLLTTGGITDGKDYREIIDLGTLVVKLHILK